jgi:RING finger/CHY zinc finger protein 1
MDDQLQDQIRGIWRNKSLTPVERQQQIVELRRSIPSLAPSSAPSSATSIAQPITPPCPHYTKSNWVISECCGKRYGCHQCHDESEEHKMNRFITQTMICGECDESQKITKHSQYCENKRCMKRISNYYCHSCRLWGSHDACKGTINHCADCGICVRYVAGIVYKHCNDCRMCMPLVHKCNANTHSATCVVCFEQVGYSVKGSMSLTCRHSVHSECYKNLCRFDYRCPTCKKCLAPMDALWDELRTNITNQPLPDELRQTISVYCFDCETETKSEFHPIGNMCTNCYGFNTSKA